MTHNTKQPQTLQFLIINPLPVTPVNHVTPGSPHPSSPSKMLTWPCASTVSLDSCPPLLHSVLCHSAFDLQHPTSFVTILGAHLCSFIVSYLMYCDTFVFIWLAIGNILHSLSINVFNTPILMRIGAV